MTSKGRQESRPFLFAPAPRVLTQVTLLRENFKNFKNKTIDIEF
jgi:hypothetical protein